MKPTVLLPISRWLLFLNGNRVPYPLHTLIGVARLMAERGQRVLHRIKPPPPVDSREAFDMLEDYEDGDD